MQPFTHQPAATTVPKSDAAAPAMLISSTHAVLAAAAPTVANFTAGNAKKPHAATVTAAPTVEVIQQHLEHWHVPQTIFGSSSWISVFS